MEKYQQTVMNASTGVEHLKSPLEKGVVIYGYAPKPVKSTPQAKKRKKPTARPQKTVYGNCTPVMSTFWKGMGGNHNSMGEMVKEFVDNSLSSFLTSGYGDNKTALHRQIFITCNYLEERDVVYFSHEDTGPGISNIHAALTFGDKSQQTSTRNEHGFGLKHAIAAGDPENLTFKIYTRTEEEYRNGTYRTVQAPYKFVKMPCTVVKDKITPWPGKYSGSGTIISFECQMSLFMSIVKDVGGTRTFTTALKFLRDDLGYTYANAIKDTNVAIQIASYGLKDGDLLMDVRAMEPSIVKICANGKATMTGSMRVDLGGPKDVLMKYQFAEIEDRAIELLKAHPDEIRGKYYRANLKSQGAEVATNGRVVEDNVITQIWNVDPHNSYNHFHAKIHLISDDPDSLPMTNTAKSGFRTGDPKFETLCKKIHDLFPKIEKRINDTTTESDLLDQLQENIENLARLQGHPFSTSRELTCFASRNSKIQADMHSFVNGHVTVYEGKRDSADVLALYQLRAYWDGIVCDGGNVHDAVLVSSSISSGVAEVMAFLNTLKDPTGTQYNFRHATWQSYGIQYPA